MKEVLPSQWLNLSLLFKSNIKNCKPIAAIAEKQEAS